MKQKKLGGVIFLGLAKAPKYIVVFPQGNIDA